MAARRLVAVLLVMLFLSSLAAALAPVEQREDATTSSSSSTTTTPSASAGAGQLVVQSLDLPTRTPREIGVEVGDQLQLRITSKRTGTVELANLGEDADVGPDQPAQFDVLLGKAGRYPVRFLGTEEPLATIVVR